MTGEPATARRGSAREVFGVFLKLGVTSFGGPIAHLGYFRDELVRRRKWVDDREYGDLVALCQFLPGPASSQVGFGMGLHRAGPLGALAAFLAFTLPSAALLVAFALGAALFQGTIGTGILTGLKIVAVAIVAQAVWGMAKALTPDRERAAIAVVAALSATLLAGSLGQIAAILFGALAGLLVCRRGTTDLTGQMRFPVSRTAGITCLALFVLLLLGLPVLALATGSAGITVFEAFYRAGALVFGGGHVVLPLLQAGVVDPGWVTSQQFLAGYGAAQAVPGPLFTFAAYLGTASGYGPGGAAGAAVALAGIFLPGFLLLTGVLPFWNSWRSRPGAQALMRGANAAVVGILAAALYNPLFTTAITGPGPFCLGLVCFVLLIAWKAPPWAVVLVGAAGGVLLALAG
ncbi:chromate transporter, chromate ion transporter (CHR) family [Pseudarthrobacter chlorophenolicus A6]|uniref:Chromate transporter, chromate ion transporter (CHR) family n=1 Tax=Pseudarthrobacter chlorophenolicus (strain ATCC 700700 / DSM 12829 / CIP 107037 / JCM 12360 / KCTC 9906 / NCIMB 13794 / A6) TaxID=452863 RepID=B8HF16_PSECP|nr:chromate efflux transporter [Pseudarthrobacter chlorophenolicus]ACL40984.1 chromate transporter, chromate ion transporter (CHR) family [Pseudarthrobacter chlorophenolicus A6]SDQ71814.1 chromate transporter [Pseudarthrobacter chlorophenolicus]